MSQIPKEVRRIVVATAAVMGVCGFGGALVATVIMTTYPEVASKVLQITEAFIIAGATYSFVLVRAEVRRMRHGSRPDS